MTKNELIQSINESHMVDNHKNKVFVAIPQTTVHAINSIIKTLTYDQTKAIKRYVV